MAEAIAPTAPSKVANLMDGSHTGSPPIPDLLGGTTINVTGGAGDLQAAINGTGAFAGQGALDGSGNHNGNTYVCPAGAVYSQLLLPTAGTGYTCIRSGGTLPAFGTTIVPASHASQLFRIQGGGSDEFTRIPIRVLNGTSGWRFIGMELVPPDGLPTQHLFSNYLSNIAGVLTNRMCFERCYLHPFDSNQQIHFAMWLQDSFDIQVWDSYIESHSDGTPYPDDCAIYTRRGSRFHFEHNEARACSENFALGDQDAGDYSTDGTILRNHLFKPPEWSQFSLVDGITPNPSWNNHSPHCFVKNSFEIKMAKRVLFEGNLCENVWIGADQPGNMLAMQTNPAPCDVFDVMYRNNTFDTGHGAFTFYNFGTDAKLITRVAVLNNLFKNLHARPFNLFRAGEDMWIEHNTFLVSPDTNQSIQEGLITCGVGVAGTSYPRLTIRRNVWGRSVYGMRVVSLNGDPSDGAGTPQTSVWNANLPDRVVVENAEYGYGAAGSYPPGGIAVFASAAAAGITTTTGVLASNSPLKAGGANGGSDGKDLGVDFDDLDAAQQNTPTIPIVTFNKVQTPGTFTMVFTDTSSGGPFSAHYWQLLDTDGVTVLSTETTLNHTFTYPAAGQYFVDHRETNAQGTGVSGQIAISVAPIASANRRALFPDPFTGTNADLGASWDRYSGVNGLQRVSDQARAEVINAPVNCLERHTGTLPNDQWAQVTVGAFVASDYNAIGIGVRWAVPNTITGYLLMLDAAGGGPRLGLYKSLAGVDSTLVAPASVSIAPGDTLSLEVETVGATAVLRGFRNGTQVLSFTDSAAPIASGGALIEAYPTASLANAIIEDFVSGDFTGTPNQAPTIVIEGPTSAATFPTSSPTIILTGTATDVTSVTWANTTTGVSGVADGLNSWTTPVITLQAGANVLPVTGHGQAPNAQDTITVTYTPIPPSTPLPPDLMRGFGPLRGVAANDVIQIPLTTHAAQSTFRQWDRRDGSGARCLFTKSSNAIQTFTEGIFAPGDSLLHFYRQYSGGTGHWTCPEPAAGARYCLVFKIDTGAPTALPIVKINNAIQSLTVVRQPGAGETPVNNTSGYMLGNWPGQTGSWLGDQAKWTKNAYLTTDAEDTAFFEGSDPLTAPASVTAPVAYHPLSGTANEPDSVTTTNSVVTGTAPQNYAVVAPPTVTLAVTSGNPATSTPYQVTATTTGTVNRVSFVVDGAAPVVRTVAPYLLFASPDLLGPTPSPHVIVAEVFETAGATVADTDTLNVTEPSATTGTWLVDAEWDRLATATSYKLDVDGGATLVTVQQPASGNPRTTFPFTGADREIEVGIIPVLPGPVDGPRMAIKPRRYTDPSATAIEGLTETSRAYDGTNWLVGFRWNRKPAPVVSYNFYRDGSVIANILQPASGNPSYVDTFTGAAVEKVIGVAAVYAGPTEGPRASTKFAYVAPATQLLTGFQEHSRTFTP